MKPSKPVKRTVKRDEMQHYTPDHRGYALVDDEAFDRRGKEMLAYVRSDRPDGDRIAIFCQAVTIKDHTGKRLVQLQCALLNRRETLMLRNYVLKHKLGVRPVPAVTKRKKAKRGKA